MKIGDIINFRGIYGKVIGETISLFTERKTVYFVRLDNGEIIEQYEEDLKPQLKICGLCKYYEGRRESYGRCMKKTYSKLRGCSVLFGDPICINFKTK